MQKFVQQTLTPYLGLYPDAGAKQNAQLDIKNCLKSFIKSETSGITKDLTNKTRQCFLLSSDIQNLKETISSLEKQISKLKSDKILIEQQKTKMKMQFQKQSKQLEDKIGKLSMQQKKILQKAESDLISMQDDYQYKLRELKKEHQKILNEAIEKQIQIKQQEIQQLKNENSDQKRHIMEQASKDKKKLIQKYEEKIFKLTQDFQKKIEELEKIIKNNNDSFKNYKITAQNKIGSLNNHNTRLDSDLKTQKKSHEKYANLYHQSKQSYQTYKNGVQASHQQLVNALNDIRSKLAHQEKRHQQSVTKLKRQLADTIEQKDRRYTQTVQTMLTEHKITIESLIDKYMTDKQTTMNDLQVKRYEENFAHMQKYEALQKKYQQLEQHYNYVKRQFDVQVSELKQQHQIYVKGLNFRLEYQLGVSLTNKERQTRQITQMYQLQIAAMKRQQIQQLEQLTKKMTDDRIAAINKVTSQYESMLNDLRSSQQIQIKQKMLQFERKAKGFEKKIMQADRRRSQARLATDRVKMQMQMKIDSMLDVTKRLEQEIFESQDKIQQIQNEKSRIISEYELKIVILNNQMKQIADDYAVRQQELKQVLDSKLEARNRQISRLSEKLKKQTIQLIKNHQEKVTYMQNQYNQLKKVVALKTSLPEDIEALKVFHEAFIQKEQELNKQRVLRQQLQRQLKAKEAIDKVFANKNFIVRKNQTNKGFF